MQAKKTHLNSVWSGPSVCLLNPWTWLWGTDFLQFLPRETTSVLSYCTLNPFWKGVNSKRKFTPKSKVFPFFRRQAKQFWQLSPLEEYHFSLNKLTFTESPGQTVWKHRLIWASCVSILQKTLFLVLHTMCMKEISFFSKCPKISKTLYSTFFTKFCFSLRKHAYSNILKILPPKNENFQIKNSNIFFIFLHKT